VFAGPHGYVSPSVYDATPAAPTWDFTSVHVRGKLHPLDRREDTLEVVKATVTTIESEFAASWDMRASLPYFETILRGVSAFEVVIDSVEAMFKLSQEQEPRIRARVARSFGASDLGHHRQLADLINRMETVGAAAPSAAGGADETSAHPAAGGITLAPDQREPAGDPRPSTPLFPETAMRAPPGRWQSMNRSG
jgi:Putative FMN-binding domain